MASTSTASLPTWRDGKNASCRDVHVLSPRVFGSARQALLLHIQHSRVEGHVLSSCYFTDASARYDYGSFSLTNYVLAFCDDNFLDSRVHLRFPRAEPDASFIET